MFRELLFKQGFSQSFAPVTCTTWPKGLLKLRRSLVVECAALKFSSVWRKAGHRGRLDGPGPLLPGKTLLSAL